MAAITPRKNKSGEIISYTIRVYRGYDSSGNRLKPYTMTYKPEPGMTAKQVEKELNRRSVQFEDECKNGLIGAQTGGFRPDLSFLHARETKPYRLRLLCSHTGNACAACARSYQADGA